MTEDIIEQKRLHISGLPAKVTTSDVEDRFRSFGQVKNVEIIPHRFDDGCRGFAYVNIDISEGQLSRCMNLLNGSSWRGGRLRISLAKPNIFERIAKSQSQPLPEEPKEKPKKKRPLRRLSSHKTLVTDKNVDDRKGWRRGRYGRAIALLKIRKPSGDLIVYDPSHYKNNLEKLFGSVKPKPIWELAWTITDFDRASRSKFERKQVELVEEEQEEEEIEGEEEVIEESNEMQVDTLEDLQNVKSDEFVDIEGESGVEEVVDIETESIQDVEIDVDQIIEDQITEEVQMITEETVEQIEESPVVQLNEEEESETKESESEMILSTKEDQIQNAAVQTNQDQNEEDKSSSKFQVNVNWNDLFSTQATSGGFSLGLTGFAPVEESKPVQPVEMETSVVAAKKSEVVIAKESIPENNFNFISLFSDLRKSSGVKLAPFGITQDQRAKALDAWKAGRYELKQDYKQRQKQSKKLIRRRKTLSSSAPRE